MAYSPPLDGAVGLIIIYAFFLGIAAFLGVTIVENIILWRFGWGSFLHSLLTAFVMNLVSTIVGVVMAYTLLFSVRNISVAIYLVLFSISVVIEGTIMLGMKRSKYEAGKVWQLAVIANVISYILLGIGWLIFLEVS